MQSTGDNQEVKAAHRGRRGRLKGRVRVEAGVRERRQGGTGNHQGGEEGSHPLPTPSPPPQQGRPSPNFHRAPSRAQPTTTHHRGHPARHLPPPVGHGHALTLRCPCLGPHTANPPLGEVVHFGIAKTTQVLIQDRCRRHVSKQRAVCGRGVQTGFKTAGCSKTGGTRQGGRRPTDPLCCAKKGAVVKKTVGRNARAQRNQLYIRASFTYLCALQTLEHAEVRGMGCQKCAATCGSCRQNAHAMHPRKGEYAGAMRWCHGGCQDVARVHRQAIPKVLQRRPP